jgi:hypothetical protein
MGMKSAGRRAFNPVASAGVDISAMLEDRAATESSPLGMQQPEQGEAALQADDTRDVALGNLDAAVADDATAESDEVRDGAPDVATLPTVPKTAPVAAIAAAVQERPVVPVASAHSEAATVLASRASGADEPVMQPPARSDDPLAGSTRAARPRVRRPKDAWPVDEVTLEAGKAPASGRYIWHIEQSVFELSEKERSDHGIPTWGEYFIAILAQHARELDTVFPSLGYDLSVFGLGVMARRGYRKHDQPTVPAAVYLPRGPQGQGIAEVIERYAARARSKSAFAQQLVEHHLRAVGRM